MHVSFYKLYQASQQCQQGKAKSADCQRYNARMLDELFDTQTALQSKKWRPAPMQVFVADNGSKPREICSPAYRDRVVHHVFVPELQKVIEPKFIHDCAANIKGKGTHFAVERVQRMMRKTSRAPATHYLQLDIANFFYSIKHDVLFALLKAHLQRAVRDKKMTLTKAADLEWLCRTVLHAPKLNIRRQHEGKLNELPLHKRIANCDNGVGLPIGNLSSQFFSNVYLNELDQYVKHHLKCPHYVRYVDDFVLLNDNPAQLALWRKQISAFLASKLALKLKPEQRLGPINQGIDFLGYIVRPHYCYPRKRVLHNWSLKLEQWRMAAGVRKTTRRVSDSNCGDKQADLQHYSIDSLLVSSSLSDALDKLAAICASYLGHCQKANSFNAIQSLLDEHAWLRIFFVIDGLSWQPRWKSRKVKGFQQQCQFFKKQFPACDALLIQIGNCFLHIEQNQTCLLPLHQIEPFMRRLKNQKKNFAWVAEQGYIHNRLKHRQLKHLFIGDQLAEANFYKSLNLFSRVTEDLLEGPQPLTTKTKL